MADLKVCDNLAMLSSIENISLNNFNCPTSNEKCPISGTGTVKKATTQEPNWVTNEKVAKAILICHPKSYAFADRTLTLDKPAKIGRAVSHNTKAAPNNGIFDCRVLSRNHALMWYANGTFYLKDTKSSNGTFVNTERLSKSGEESEPVEIHSGDVVQFGVDVTESSVNITHGCIIATLKLILPDGRDLGPKPLIDFTSAEKSKVSLEELYHLNQYIQDALHREEMLESKLATLKQVVQSLRDSTDLSWKALISNSSLLSRVELLEARLNFYPKNFTEDQLRGELRLLQEDKVNYQGAVKQFFQKIIDEKLEAAQKCTDLSRALGNSKTECSNAKQLLTSCQTELRDLARKNSVQEKAIEGLQSDLSSTEQKKNHLEKELKKAQEDLTNQIIRTEKSDAALKKTVEDTKHGIEERILRAQIQVRNFEEQWKNLMGRLLNPEYVRSKIQISNSVFECWLSMYEETYKDVSEIVCTSENTIERLNKQKIEVEKGMSEAENELQKCESDLRSIEEEEIDLENKIKELKKHLEFEKKPITENTLIESVKKLDTSFDLRTIELQDKRKLLAVLQLNGKILNEKCTDLRKTYQNLKTEFEECRISYAIEQEKLCVAEKEYRNLGNTLNILREFADDEETVRRNEIKILKKDLEITKGFSDKRQQVIEKLLEYITEYENVMNQKLDFLEYSVIEFSDFSSDVYNIQRILNKLKNETYILSSAENSTCTTEPSNQKSKSSESDICSGDSPTTFEQNDELIILKEKYRIVTNEKLIMEQQLLKLQEEFSYLTNFPNFDVFFILPFVILILGLIFRYWNMLPTFF